MPDDTSRDAAHRFTAMYDAYYHRILGYVRRRVGPDDSSDIVAETFAVAWRRLDRVPDGDGALYWLYATARRVVANHRRADRRRLTLMQAIEREPLPSTSSEQIAPPFAVTDALAQLRADERELLLLVAWEGLDAAAIAAVLGCSRNAVRIRLHRARRHFAEALASADAPRQMGVGGQFPRSVLSIGRAELEERP